jgi:hypothetical protein
MVANANLNSVVPGEMPKVIPLSTKHQGTKFLSMNLGFVGKQSTRPQMPFQVSCCYLAAEFERLFPDEPLVS